MEKHKSSLRMVVALLFASLLGCGGESSGPTDAGKADTGTPPAATDAKVTVGDAGGFSASSTQRPSQLTTTEQQAFCDQIAANQGGYGRVVSCSGGSQTTDTSRASCVAGLPSLAVLCPTLTVGDIIGCSVAQGADLCKFTTIPECSALRACLG